MGGAAWEVLDFTGTQGTQVEVRDLFFNTPGRLKFLKTVGTEFSKICYVIQQAATVHPGVHFRLRHQQHNVLEYPAVPTPHDRLLQLYGPEFLERFLPVTHHAGSFQLTGFTVSPHHARTSRTPQEIFVNGRPIKNTTISHAVMKLRIISSKRKTSTFSSCLSIWIPRQSISMSTRLNGKFVFPIHAIHLYGHSSCILKLSFSRNQSPDHRISDEHKDSNPFRLLLIHRLPGQPPNPLISRRLRFNTGSEFPRTSTDRPDSIMFPFCPGTASLFYNGKDQTYRGVSSGSNSSHLSSRTNRPGSVHCRLRPPMNGTLLRD